MSELVPDSIEPIIAVRAWKIVESSDLFVRALIEGEVPDYAEIIRAYRKGEGQLDLRSAFHQDIVWHGGRLEARCSSEKAHTAPAEGCTCGIYALADTNRLIDGFGFGEGAHVLGVVALSGKVIPGSSGWRAQRAKVIGLFNDPTMPIKLIAAKIGVPVLDQVPALTPPLIDDESTPVSVSVATFKEALEACIRVMHELGDRLGIASTREKKKEGP